MPGMANTDWVLATEEDGITVYTRNVDGSPVKQFKAATRLFQHPVKIFVAASCKLPIERRVAGLDLNAT